MINEIPLPIPRAVICSPSHMMKTVPVVSTRIVMRMKPIPLVAATVLLAPSIWLFIDCNHVAIKAPWMTDNRTVP